MNPLDLLLAMLVLLLVLGGARTGLLSGAFSLAGLLAGAYLGSRAALAAVAAWPWLGVYGPLPLVCAVVLCGATGRVVAGAAGRRLRSGLRRVSAVGRTFGTLDGIGGALLGAVVGLAVVLALGFFVARAPLPAAQEAAEDSDVLEAIDERVPPRLADRALAELYPRPETVGLGVSEPDSSAAVRRGTRQATPGVVRVSALGSSEYGLGSSGSGWVAAPGFVVTNAHVVDGAESVGVSTGGWRGQRPARVVVFDQRNDVAVLEVDGLEARALPTGAASSGQQVTILGYPGGGPLDAGPGRVGWTGRILAADASGGLPVRRTVTSVSAEARPGNSGGPVVNGRGEVVATVFGTRVGLGRAAYAVPSSIVEDRVRLAQRRVGEA